MHTTVVVLGGIEKMTKYDYFALLEIAVQELHPDKNPTICDSCNAPLGEVLDEDDNPSGFYLVPC